MNTNTILTMIQRANVEWKPLGEVVLPTKNIKWKDDDGIYQYIDLTSVDLTNKSIVQTSEISRENAPSRAQKLVATDDVIFATTRPTQMRVTVIPQEFDGQIASTGYCVLRADKSKVLPKWIYFNLSAKAFERYLEDNQSGSAYPAISDSKLKEFEIPIPPISLQKEIVNILDTMTALTSELTSELNLRQKQYQYYRDKLLTFGDDVEWKTLGKIVLPTKNIKWKDDDGIYQYIDLTSVDLTNKSIVQTSEINKENAPSRAQKLVATDDVIFATTRPTQMRVTVIPQEFDGQIASTGYCVLRADKSKVLPKWIYFNLSAKAFERYLEDNQSGSAYPAISDSKLKEFEIPIPPLETQAKIVAILDKFDTLTQSISDGLPREIELRHKQYQYYREQLLNFQKN